MRFRPQRRWKPLIRQRMWFPKWRRQRLSPPGDWWRRPRRKQGGDEGSGDG